MGDSLSRRRWLDVFRRESLAEQATEFLHARIRRRSGKSAGSCSAKRHSPCSSAPAGPPRGRRSVSSRAAVSSPPAKGPAYFSPRLTSPRAGIPFASVDILAVIEARTANEIEAAALAAERHRLAELQAVREALGDRERHRADFIEHVETDMTSSRCIVVALHLDLAQTPAQLRAVTNFPVSELRSGAPWVRPGNGGRPSFDRLLWRRRLDPHIIGSRIGTNAHGRRSGSHRVACAHDGPGVVSEFIPRA